MLTREQVDQFHRDGFLRIPKLFQGAELAALRAAADVVQAEGEAKIGAEKHRYRNMPDGEKRYFRSEWMWDRDPIFKAVTVHPELLTAIAQCTGHPFLPINDSFVCKTPRSNVPIEWHQDPPYGSVKWQKTHPVVNFDVDIYLDDSTVENGCVWGIPGHHLVGHVELQKYSEKELFEDFGAVPMLMEPGDVLFHCLSAPHGSVGNLTDSLRRIFYVHYMAREVFNDCYNGASGAMNKGRGNYDAERIAHVRSMFEARAQFGWANIEDQPVELTDDGFVYTGDIGTPLLHWGRLIEAMDPAEIEAKKKLQRVTVSR